MFRPSILRTVRPLASATWLSAAGTATAVAAAAAATVAAPAEAFSKPNNKERTYIMIKPDGVQRGLVGEIFKRFEQKGFRCVALKMMTPTVGRLQEHYSDLAKKPFFPSLVEYMASGPVVCMVWEGSHAVKTGRVLLGETNPTDSTSGSIRGDYCIEVHCPPVPRRLLLLRPAACLCPCGVPPVPVPLLTCRPAPVSGGPQHLPRQRCGRERRARDRAVVQAGRAQQLRELREELDLRVSDVNAGPRPTPGPFCPAHRH